MSIGAVMDASAPSVMAGLDPAIHAAPGHRAVGISHTLRQANDVDGRVKPGHDEPRCGDRR